MNEYWLLFTNISEILNRRPIQGTLFEDSINFITPNNLILGRTSKYQPIVAPKYVDSKLRLQLIEDLKAQFWKRLINVLATDSQLMKYQTWYQQSRTPKVGDIVLVLYKSKIHDSYRIGKIENVIDNRNLELIVASLQNGNTTDFKVPTKMNVPIQRTILLYSANDD